jgi:hypothetical protein
MLSAIFKDVKSADQDAKFVREFKKDLSLSRADHREAYASLDRYHQRDSEKLLEQTAE